MQLGQGIEGESPWDYSGTSVSLSSDGNIIAIGARENDGNGSNNGHVRVFNWDGTSWSQIGQDIDGEANPNQAGDQSGGAVSVNAAGDRVIIGAIYNDGNGSDAGHVRIYDWNGAVWIQLGQDIDGDEVNGPSGT